MTNVEFHGSSRGRMLFLSGLSLKRFFGKRGAVFVSCLAFGVIAQVLLQSAEAQIKYTVTRLVPISGVSSFPTGLNAQGDVVGTYTWRDGTKHVFLNHAGIMHDIADLAGSNPTGINIYGRIVGWSIANVDGLTTVFPYTYFGKKTWFLSNQIPGLAPVAVNTASHIVCSSDSGAYIWQKSGINFLPPQNQDDGGGPFIPTAINNSDQVAGSGYDLMGHVHAFLFSGGQKIDLGMLLSSLGFSYAQALNDQGQVAGGSLAPGAYHAFLYSGGKMRDIQTIASDIDNGSFAYGINNSGQVVGEFTDSLGNIEAFVYDGSKMTELETLIDPAAGWLLNIAWAINDAGQIIASGQFQNEGYEEACLLTPVR